MIASDEDVAMSESERVVPDRDDCVAAGKTPKVPRLNDDLLLYTFRFFVSSSGHVDGSSLKNIMLVCQRWHSIANCQSLWTIPSGSCVAAKGGDSAESNSPVAVTKSVLSITRSLQIKDVTCTSGTAEIINAEILLGFVNLGTIPCADFTLFHAEERATKTQCVIKISKTLEKTKEILREAFAAHFLQGSYLQFSVLENRQSTFQHFPVGVSIMFGRTLFFYAVKSSERPPKLFDSNNLQTSLPALYQLLLRPAISKGTGLDEIQAVRSIVQHLLNLEGHPFIDSTKAGTANNQNHRRLVRRDRWAQVSRCCCVVLIYSSLLAEVESQQVPEFSVDITSSSTGSWRSTNVLSSKIR
jgi:hypothetical protein